MQKVVLFLLSWSFVFLLLAACNPDKDKTVSPTDVRSKTTQSSVLFFKNMRSLDYDKKDEMKLKRELYLHEDRNQDSLSPALNFVIVYLWNKDRAYVVVRPNEFVENHLEKHQTDTINVRWQNPTTRAKGTISYLPGHVDTQYEFATRLYNAVISGHKLYLMPDEIPVLEKKSEREVFRITMLDYYRLVGVFK